MAKKYKEHYDCTKLINSLDANGEKPTFFCACSFDRGPGKSYQFSKLLIDRFMEKGDRFILLCRNRGDLGNVAAGVLNSYVAQAHPEWHISETSQMKSTFSNIYLTRGSGDEEEKLHVGWVVSLKSQDRIKLISSTFYSAWAFFFDEFMPTDKSSFLPNELDCLRTIYKSVARGESHATRYMPVFMSSNTLSIQNPYFMAWGITNKIQSNTKFYRGVGVIFELVEVEGLREEHAASGFDRAIQKHLARTESSNIWINDNNSLVVPKSKTEGWGRGRYVCTLIYNNDKFGVVTYDSVGITYISRVIDKSSEYVFNLTLEGELNIPLLKITPYLETLKKRLFGGLIRCSDGGVQAMLCDVFA